jgi:predicted  nucleic acid-binding Zn-ribbon protein
MSEATMSGPASLFREIHRLRRYARDLQEQLDRIPRQQKAHQARIQKREEDLRATQELIKKFKLLAIEKEKASKAKYAQISRYEEQNNQVTSKKEYDALQVEIAAARTQVNKLEDEALQALTDCDDKEQEVPGLEQAVAEARDDLARFESQIAPRRGDLEAQLGQAQKELKAVEAEIPEDILPQYNRTITSLGADGMAAVKDRTCTACYTEIIAQDEVDLERDQFVVCRSCGRILYLPTPPRAAQGEED